MVNYSHFLAGTTEEWKFGGFSWGYAFNEWGRH